MYADKKVEVLEHPDAEKFINMDSSEKKIKDAIRMSGNKITYFEGADE